MSYNLMVFDLDAAPKNRADFLAWWDEQAEWEEDHGYDDPKVLSPKLRAWFLEIIETFPAMNGPFAVDDPDNLKVTDYCIGRTLVYAGFAWSQSDEAYGKTFELAKKHGVGFFDASGAEGEVWGPNGADAYVCLHRGY